MIAIEVVGKRENVAIFKTPFSVKSLIGQRGDWVRAEPAANSF